MLNIGPDGKGVVPSASAKILREVGSWLARNGESIYGAMRSPIGMQAWGPSTLRDNKLYLHILKWPTNGEVWIPNIGPMCVIASVLSTGERLQAIDINGHLCIKLPARSPDDLVTVIEVSLSTLPATIVPNKHIHASLVNELYAPFAELSECRHAKRSWMEKFGDWHHTEFID